MNLNCPSSLRGSVNASRYPVISIIIPCWNAKAYVGEAIESALAQTYPNLDVIVIDDGSTDGSLEVIRSFGERIRWETGPNRGASAARNRGLKLARGGLIQFLDADDRLYPSKLEKMVPLAVKYGPGSAPICDWERVHEGIESAPKVQRLGYNGEDPVLFCSRSQLPTPSPLHWKRDLEAVGGFDESLPCSQERDLHLRLTCLGIRFVYLPEVLYRVRRIGGSVSSDSLRVYRQHLGIVQRACKLLEGKGQLSGERAAALAGLLARDARLFLRYGLRAEADHYFQQARTIHPKGGLDIAYLPWHRLLARLLGRRWFERLVVFKRSLPFRAV